MRDVTVIETMSFTSLFILFVGTLCGLAIMSPVILYDIITDKRKS